MSKPTHITNIDELLIEYKTNVCQKVEEVDPEFQHDWYSLCLGWAIGKGLKPSDAHEFAGHVSYDLGDFQDDAPAPHF